MVTLSFNWKLRQKRKMIFFWKKAVLSIFFVTYFDITWNVFLYWWLLYNKTCTINNSLGMTFRMQISKTVVLQNGHFPVLRTKCIFLSSIYIVSCFKLLQKWKKSEEIYKKNKFQILQVMLVVWCICVYDNMPFCC